MEKNSLNHNFLIALQDRFPKKSILAEELSNTLDMDKVSVYRRLKEETKFTVEELGILARKYNISVDKIINIAPTAGIDSIKLGLIMAKTPEDLKSDEMEFKLQFIREFVQQPYSEMGIVFNSLPIALFIPYKLILKYYWFLWGHYYFNSNQSFHCFEAVELPEILLQYNMMGYQEYQKISYTYYIWNNNLLSCLVNDLHYFQSISLISPSSILGIRDELNLALDSLENYAITEATEKGNKFELYSSDLNINKTCVYFWSEKLWAHLIPVFEVQFIHSNQKESCEIARKWLKGIRASSILISGSAERERMQFFSKQRELVNSL